MYPVLAVVSDLWKNEEHVDLVYVGRAGSIEERLARRAGIPFRSIQVGGVRGFALGNALRNVFRLLTSTMSVRRIVREFDPNAILVTGGYVSAPSIWAGAACRVPSVIYLPDLEPGWAIRATAHWATCIAVSFDQVSLHFDQKKTAVTGYPVRPEFFKTDKSRGRREFQLDPDLFTITVFGGSRGAHSINQAVMANLADFAELAQIILIAGREDEAWAKAQVSKFPDPVRARVRVFGYLDEQLPHALAAADLVIARAGAATLGEFPALGLPSVIVPYPYAGRHQENNAAFLIQHGAAIRLDNGTLKRELVPTIRSLLQEPGKLEEMSQSARKLARPEAAHNIAQLVHSLAKERT